MAARRTCGRYVTPFNYISGGFVSAVPVILFRLFWWFRFGCSGGFLGGFVPAVPVVSVVPVVSFRRFRFGVSVLVHALQNACNSRGNGSTSSLQKASGSRAPMTNNVPALHCGAAIKASGPLEAQSGQRKVKRKLVKRKLPPPTSTKSRPTPPPSFRAVSQCAQPATSRPPRPPPPSVKDAKGLSKHNEERASKDGISYKSALPQKCRSGLKTKNKYPKKLNPFGSDTSLPSSEKTSV